MAQARKTKRAWGGKTLQRKSTRQKMKRECGSGCFLEPAKLAYPICRPTARKVCKPDCQGIRAAFSRARQQKNTAVAKKALAKAKQFGCGWFRTGEAAQKLAKRWGI